MPCADGTDQQILHFFVVDPNLEFFISQELNCLAGMKGCVSNVACKGCVSKVACKGCVKRLRKLNLALRRVAWKGCVRDTAHATFPRNPLQVV